MPNALLFSLSDSSFPLPPPPLALPSYLGLETMARLAQVEGNDAVTQHEATVLSSLKDADISVRRRALDLLFVMCDASNTASIVGELVAYLVTADVAIREEMVLKIAIVAEKYATDLEW